MVYECRVNLKNKRKDDLIMYLEEALQTIQKQDTEINKLNNVIDRMAEVFSKISKGEYVTIEAHTEKDKIIEYFIKEDK